MRGTRRILACAIAAGLSAAAARAGDPVMLSAPTYDRWMYPYNGTPGARASAPTFGALAEEGFDDRDGQFYFGFDTAAAVAPGLGPEAYQVLSLTVEASIGGGDFLYDPSQDSYTSFLSPTNPLYTADADDGRPMELFGAGFRHDSSFHDFGELGPYNAGPDGEGARTVFALGFSNGVLVDVSNSVDADHQGAAGFDPVGMAVGQAALDPGSPVPAGTRIRFPIDLDRPEVAAYIRQGLDAGHLAFVIASLHEASLGGPVAYPVWDTKENIVGTPASLNALIAVLPVLTAAVQQGDLVLRWPDTGTAAVPQYTAELASPAWAGTPGTAVASNGWYQIRFPLPPGDDARYFRLANP
jgi:hypothetical protein